MDSCVGGFSPLHQINPLKAGAFTMGVIQFNIPDDVKEAFEAAFKGSTEEMDAVVAEPLRKTAEERRPRNSVGFVERIRAIRAKSVSTFTDE